jgi:bile acid-coenzyme A ligase
MNTRANRRAWALKKLGVQQDDIVALVLPNENAVFEFAFAIWKLGATPAVVSSRLPMSELRAVLQLANPRVVVARDPKVRRATGAVSVDYGLDDETVDRLPSLVGSRWKVIASGGSSGLPKLIVDLAPGEIDTDATLLELPQGAAVLNAGPLFHNAPFRFMCGALFRGNSVVSMTRFDAEESLRLIQDHRLSWANFVPTMMNRIWSLPEEVRTSYDLGSLRAVWHTAAPIPTWLKEAWIDWLGPGRVWEIYGGTERHGNTVISGDDWLTHRGSVGRPINSSVRIVDPSGAPLSSGQVGEVEFLPNTGPGSTYRYIGADPRPLRDGFEGTGDYGWLDEDGFLYIADRRADLIIRGGMNIYPAEVENALSEHPDVDLAVVIGLPDHDLGAVVHAIVRLTALGADRTTGDTLREFLSEKISRHKLPTSYEFTDAPLRDEAGKVRRSQLRAERIALTTEV